MNQRLFTLRKTLSLSQADFGEKLNIKPSTIGGYEKGRRPITDRVVTDICRDYNVNEQWLREGNGPMFRPQKSLDNIIAENAGNLIKSDCIEAKVLMAELGSMSEEELKHVYNFMTNVAKKIAAELEQQQKEQNK